MSKEERIAASEEGRTPLEFAGAYPDEMGPLPDLDDRDIDRLLAGRRVDGDLEAGHLAGLVDDVRATHLRPVAQETRERHLAAMARAARHAPSTDPPAPARARRSPRSLMPRNRYAAMLATLAATTVTAGLGGAGLAVAGVANLPDPADAALEKVGLNLDAGKDAEAERSARAAAVREIIESTPPSERRGCAFGQAVAEAARGEALPAEAKENCAEAEARRAEREAEKDAEREERADEGEETEAANGGEEAAERPDSFGAQTSQRAKQQRTASPQERRSFGPETSGLARERARDRGANAGGNPDRPAPSAGPPQKAAPPEGRGRPESPGPPENTGRSESAGPPAGAGPPVGRGRP